MTSEPITTEDHASQMSLADAKQALGAVDGKLAELLNRAKENHTNARAAAHLWARTRRKALTRYIAVLETDQPPQ